MRQAGLWPSPTCRSFARIRSGASPRGWRRAQRSSRRATPADAATRSVLRGRFGDALAALTGDAGARDLLRAEAGALELLDLDDPGVVRDVDTPADLAG